MGSEMCIRDSSHAAFASRIARAADARLTKDRRVPTLSRENRWGGNSKYFIKFIRGQMTALHKYLVLNFIYFIRSKEPLLAEQSLWGVKRLAFAAFNVLQSYRLPSFTCATVRNMFYSGDLLSPKGALGQIWVCLLYTSPSPRDLSTSRMPSSA